MGLLLSICDYGRKLRDKYMDIGTCGVVVVIESIVIIALISLIKRISILVLRLECIIVVRNYEY